MSFAWTINYIPALICHQIVVFNPTEWPAPDKPAPTDSPQVKEWLKEIEGVDIPDIPVTTDGACAESPENLAKSAEYGWWTCSGTTRSTDIVNCPTKYDWGTTFDDGPADYSKSISSAGHNIA